MVLSSMALNCRGPKARRERAVLSAVSMLTLTGIRFVNSSPAEMEMVSQAARHSPLSAPLRPVLIVEDERTSRRAMTSLLAHCGYHPEPFETAEDALQAVRLGAHPCIALVDLDLPGMNGLDLISQLEGLDPSIFPILITATDQDILAARLHNRPVAYLRKPVNFDVLLTLMREQHHRN